MQQETASPSIEVGEFQDLCKTAWEQRQKVDLMARDQAEASKVLEELKSKVLAYMEHYELEKQHIPGFGTLSVQNKFSVKVPQGDEKRIFFEALNGEGIFEDMATVHSNTLNAWYEERMEAALAKGIIDFKYPGIAEAKLRKTLGFRKG